jgi:NADPH2:quinone reductase
MRAVTLRAFGGPDQLRLETIPEPSLAAHEVLVRVHVAGVGEWDPFEREGGYAEMLGQTPHFPYVLGSEGAGHIAALGAEVHHLREGDPVYAVGFLNPKGGFYAQHVAVDARMVKPRPGGLTVEQAAVVGGVGLTALRGLEDVLELKRGESVLILGANGGMGHLVLQLARRKGARVLAVASGADGVALVERLGAEVAVDGRRNGLLDAARAFAPRGVDTAFLTAGGPIVEQVLSCLRPGGRAVYPGGVRPEPQPRRGTHLQSFNGEPDPEILDRLHHLFEEAPLEVHVSKVFPMAQVADAHRALGQHHTGKLALRID